LTTKQAPAAFYMKKLIELRNISAGYNGEMIIDKVNLDINEKDFIGIIGPNGGGKTTLLKVILGLLKPRSGKISYFFGNSNIEFRKHMGYLPQHISFDSDFPISVKEVVLSGLISGKNMFKRMSRKDHQKAEAIIEKNGLKKFAGTPVGELSGGQMQRVFLSRAMISSPQLLILDEPDTFVDNRFEHELYSTLKELNEELAILLVSHDVGTISTYVKTIACVNKTLHYHPSNEITAEQLKVYNCPIDIITHGTVPHRVLPKHKN